MVTRPEGRPPPKQTQLNVRWKICCCVCTCTFKPQRECCAPAHGCDWYYPFKDVQTLKRWAQALMSDISTGQVGCLCVCAQVCLHINWLTETCREQWHCANSVFAQRKTWRDKIIYLFNFFKSATLLADTPLSGKTLLQQYFNIFSCIRGFLCVLESHRIPITKHLLRPKYVGLGVGSTPELLCATVRLKNSLYRTGYIMAIQYGVDIHQIYTFIVLMFTLKRSS